MKPVHVLPPNFFKTHYNIIIPSTSRSSKQSLYMSFLRQNFVCISIFPHSCHILLDFVTRIIFCDDVILPDNSHPFFTHKFRLTAGSEAFAATAVSHESGSHVSVQFHSADRHTSHLTSTSLVAGLSCTN
jgi:hypothetical protein